MISTHYIALNESFKEKSILIFIYGTCLIICLFLYIAFCGYYFELNLHVIMYICIAFECALYFQTYLLYIFFAYFPNQP